MTTRETDRKHAAAVEEMTNAASGITTYALIAPSQCREILRRLSRLEFLEHEPADRRAGPTSE